MQRSRMLVLAALVAGLASLALVRPRAAPEYLDVPTLVRLLQAPPDARPGVTRKADPEPFWKALLALAGTRTDATTTLRLGRVLADPSAARGSALSAGELLELEAEGPDGPLGIPLWQVVLEQGVVQAEGRSVLRLYGCRHSADADAGPVLEDSYHARLALASTLARHGAERAEPVLLEGSETPVRGGVNFEVQLVGSRQSVSVTFDGHPERAFRASREARPEAPNDARARANLVAALRELVRSEPGFQATFEGLEAPAPGGVDVRLELYGARIALTVHAADGARLATHLEPAGSEPQAEQ